MQNKKTVSIKLVRSISGRRPSHVATIAGLGLKRIRQIVELEDTPSVAA